MCISQLDNIIMVTNQQNLQQQCRIHHRKPNVDVQDVRCSVEMQALGQKDEWQLCSLKYNVNNWNMISIWIMISSDLFVWSELIVALYNNVWHLRSTPKHFVETCCPLRRKSTSPFPLQIKRPVWLDTEAAVDGSVNNFTQWLYQHPVVREYLICLRLCQY